MTSTKEPVSAGLTRVRQPERLVNKQQRSEPSEPIEVINEVEADVTVVDEQPSMYPSLEEEMKANIEPEIDPDIEALRKAKVEQSLRVVEERVHSAEPEKPGDPLFVNVPGVPSNGKVFDTKNSIFYKKYTYGDYEDSNNIDVPLADRYALILRGIRVDTLSSNLLLPLCDFKYISVIRRLEAQGSREFTAPYTCVRCNQIGTFNFKLEEIGFNTFDYNLPVRVRFHSYPNDVMEFGLPTIGDVITLLRDDNYYKKSPENGEYILDNDGNYIIDDLAITATACTSHDFDTAYSKLDGITSRDDYQTIKKLQGILDPGITPFEFTCKLYLPMSEEEQKRVAEENEKKMAHLRDSHGNMPSFVRFVNKHKGKTVCGAKNRLNIAGGDVYFFPFRESTIDTEYGILSM